MINLEFGVQIDMDPMDAFIRSIEQLVGRVDDVEVEKSDKIVWETDTGATITLRGEFTYSSALGALGDVDSIEIHAADNSLIMSASEFNDEASLDDDDTVEFLLEQIDEGAAIVGSRFDDVLLGGRDQDILNGAAGDDILDGLGGNDQLRGGRGDDTYFIDGIAEIDKSLSDPSVDTVKTSLSYTLGAEQENLTLLGTGNINGTGNAKANFITGNGANNALAGSGGSDTLNGRAGADMLTGQEGADTLVGGPANDILNGSGGNDELSGGTGSDTANGGKGNDNIKGGAGSDSLLGGAGNDGLNGGDGRDQLKGQDGVDTLDGGPGNDELAGGSDNDVFLFNDRLGAGNVDTIMDFGGAGVAARDLIHLDEAIFTSLSTGALPGTAFESGAGLTAAATPEGRIIYDTTSGTLYYDADGNGTDFAAIQFAVITTAVNGLSAADFVIV